MADTYFCFSDECGIYQPHMTAKQIKNHPFYIRATLLLNSNEWKFLNNQLRGLKNKYSIPQNTEIKWASLWTLRSFQKNKKPIPNKHVIKHLEYFDYHILIDFVEEVLSLINKLKEKKIIVTYTVNAKQPGTNEVSMLAFHLQELMQRLEMELQVDKDNLGVLFFDPVSTEKNELFREIYNNLYESGDFFTKYSFIKDSLNIENSHQSVGIQVADYISGTFSAVLKSTIYNDYSRGVKMFFDYVYPNLRRKWNGTIQGYGIREVPKSPLTRNWLDNQFIEFKPKQTLC